MLDYEATLYRVLSVYGLMKAEPACSWLKAGLIGIAFNIPDRLGGKVEMGFRRLGERSEDPYTSWRSISCSEKLYWQLRIGFWSWLSPAFLHYSCVLRINFVHTRNQDGIFSIIFKHLDLIIVAWSNSVLYGKQYSRASHLGCFSAVAICRECCMDLWRHLLSILLVTLECEHSRKIFHFHRKFSTFAIIRTRQHWRWMLLADEGHAHWSGNIDCK